MTTVLPCVCMTCKRTYKHIEAYREIKPGEVSHGYCPKHAVTALDEHLFGKNPLDHSPTLAEVNARRGFDEPEDLR
jgi:hypothetical protein